MFALIAYMIDVTLALHRLNARVIRNEKAQGYRIAGNLR